MKYHWRWIAFGLFVLALGILAVTTKYGWIIRDQTKTVFYTPAYQGELRVLKDLDYPRETTFFFSEINNLDNLKTQPNLEPKDSNTINLAKASYQRTPSDALIELYPNDPAVYALNLIHWEVYKHTRINKSEATTHLKSVNHNFEPGINNGEAVKIINTCEKGEQLVPNNAFFTYYKAMATYITGKPNEAIAILKQAQAKPDWNDYSGDIARARFEQFQLLTKNHLPIFDELYQNESYSHQFNYEGFTEALVDEAVKCEKSGAISEGGAIRLAMIECYSKMRYQPLNIRATFRGSGLIKQSIAYPGGNGMSENNIKSSISSKLQSPSNDILKYYCVNGYPEIGERISLLILDSDTATSTVHDHLERLIAGGETTSQSNFLWFSGCLLLFLGFGFAILSGLVIAIEKFIKKPTFKFIIMILFIVGVWLYYANVGGIASFAMYIGYSYWTDFHYPYQIGVAIPQATIPKPLLFLMLTYWTDIIAQYIIPAVTLFILIGALFLKKPVTVTILGFYKRFGAVFAILCLIAYASLLPYTYSVITEAQQIELKRSKNQCVELTRLGCEPDYHFLFDKKTRDNK